MTIWTIFTEASLINQLILLLLLIFSLISWAVIFDRWRFYHSSSKADLKFYKLLKGTVLSVDQVHQKAKKVPSAPSAMSFIAAEKIISQGKENSSDAWFNAFEIERDLIRTRAESGMHILAIVASASPFVGLLGTVWGVMIAFLKLGDLQGQPALEVVGPGIAEALIATAAGLFAAIPATIAYNAFLASMRKLLRQSENFQKRFIFAHTSESSDHETFS